SADQWSREESVRDRSIYAALTRCAARGVVVERLSIHRYKKMTMPMNASTPNHGAGLNDSGTSAIGASVVNATMSPAFTTPHTLSPTINPDATSVPNR